MIWNRCLLVLVFSALIVLGSGCETLPKPDAVTCVDDVIRVGDILKISLIVPGEGGGASDKEFLVGSDGTVNLYLLGPMKAANVKFADLEKAMQKSYIEKNYFKQVTVVVKPGDRFYTVAGEVKSPGRQFYIGQTTVLRAIAICGDFTEFSNRRRVEITRADGKREVMDCKKAIKDARYDRPLCPGDHVHVSRSL